VLVVDASAMLDVLLNRPAAAALRKRFSVRGESLHAPHLIDAEVLQVLRRFARTGELSDERAAEVLDDYRNLPMERYPHALFLTRAWELRDGITAHDAMYVALAEALDAPLLTSDARLAKSLPRTLRVEVFA
jgi:predicted nucleic acid-binding protein